MIRNWIRSIWRAQERRALVLMYHRVATLSYDPWDLAVSPQHFEAHLQVVSRRYSVVPVEQLVAQYHSNTLRAGTIAITFDDGYRDNYEVARPLLERYGCPASFYIASQYVDQQESFWWDKLAQLIFGPVHLPPVLTLTSPGATPWTFAFRENPVATPESRRKEQDWRWPQPPPTERCALYLALWERLRPLPYSEQLLVLAQVDQWALTESAANMCQPMTIEQVKNLASHPLFSVGLHTHTHPALAAHVKAVQQTELLVNKQCLEAWCQQPVPTLTYPYGICNEDTLQLVASLGLRAAFTTREEVLTPEAAPYQWGRFQVKNWDGAIFERKLREWLET